MARSLLTGTTDYRNQSLKDIQSDLIEWKKNIEDTINSIMLLDSILQKNKYWEKVPSNVIGLFNYLMKFFKTSSVELEEIILEITQEVKSNHVTRIRSLAKTAHVLDLDFNRIWHREYEDKDYGNPDFSLLEDIYCKARDMNNDMFDLSNVASRLEDFIGVKKNEVELGTNSKKKGMDIISLIILAIFIPFLIAVAANNIPDKYQQYTWLSWPLIIVFVVMAIIIFIKQSQK